MLPGHDGEGMQGVVISSVADPDPDPAGLEETQV